MPELYYPAASRMGSVILALLRHRVVEQVPESYLIDPVTSLKSPPRGSDFRLGSIIRWLLYEHRQGQGFTTAWLRSRPVLYFMGSVTGVCLVTAWLGTRQEPYIMDPNLGSYGCELVHMKCGT